MVEQAAAMGADKLIKYYYDDNNVAPSGGPDCWSQALAVKFLPAGSPQPPPSRAVVTLPPIIVGDVTGSAKKAERAASIARKFARLALAQKGYYALHIDEPVPQDFPSNLKSAPPAVRAAFGSPDADLIIPISLGRTTGWNILFATGASASLEAAAYSKSANEIIWRSTGQGTSSSAHASPEVALAAGIGGVGLELVGTSIAHMILPSAKSIPAVWNGLEQTFQTLPDLSTPVAPQ
ncbi:MAG: hypothetical protein AB9869_07290 [Verrucomicrobiia bacterium]